jgi:hypothetical protein
VCACLSTCVCLHERHVGKHIDVAVFGRAFVHVYHASFKHCIILLRPLRPRVSLSLSRTKMLTFRTCGCFLGAIFQILREYVFHGCSARMHVEYTSSIHVPGNPDMNQNLPNTYFLSKHFLACTNTANVVVCAAILAGRPLLTSAKSCPGPQQTKKKHCQKCCDDKRR